MAEYGDAAPPFPALPDAPLASCAVPPKLAGMAAWISWLIVLVGFVLPLLHVAVSRRGGPWLPPPGSGCPLGPRTGWAVLVLFLGPLGWLMYMHARARRAASKLDNDATARV